MNVITDSFKQLVERRLWPLALLAASGLRGAELRWTVGLSLGMSAYTVANTAATTSSLGALPEGVAALLAGAIVAAILLGPRSTRQMLLGRRPPVRAPALTDAS